PYFSSHKFRFYGATQLYRAGVKLDTIRYYLGHSTIKMTEHYLRLTPEDADMDVINRIFG
ncbi:MAG: site-specific integrase, partial [Acetatifactor sp.]|nr:site-specific integrase [Acetatifactor sp.]